MYASNHHDDLVNSMTGGLAPSPPPFKGSRRLHPDGRPVGTFRDELRCISTTRNAITVLVALLTPVLLIWITLASHSHIVLIAVIPAMALAQNRLFILHHEAAHRLLFPNRRANDRIGINLIGCLMFGTGSHGYRLAHIEHHRDEFGPREPDFLLYSRYPITSKSMRRKLIRDVIGISAFRILRPRFKRLDNTKHRNRTYRFLLGQVSIAATFGFVGHLRLYFFLWLLPWVVVYQPLNRLRAIAEHGGMTRSSDRRRTSHHVRQSLLARLLLVPCNVGYHLAHHVDTTVPMRNLRHLHTALVEDGYVQNLEWPNYRTLWKVQRSGSVEPDSQQEIRI